MFQQSMEYFFRIVPREMIRISNCPEIKAIPFKSVDFDGKLAKVIFVAIQVLNAGNFDFYIFKCSQFQTSKNHSQLKIGYHQNRLNEIFIIAIDLSTR